MNLFAAAPVWLLALLIAALFAAALEDVARLRISNLTCAIVAVAALVAMGFAGVPASLWQNAAGCVAILLLGSAVFAAGLLGGGDIKLLAAVGLWLDFRTDVRLAAAVFISGGAVAIGYLAVRLFRGSQNAKKDRRIPYGVAIALGALIVIGTSRGFELQHRGYHPGSGPLLAK